MKPDRDELTMHEGDIRAVAKKYNVAERTARRWLESYDLYQPTPNFGCNKLNIKIAKEIRSKYTNSHTSTKELAEMYDVTIATIRRILNNQTYKEQKTADISATYNPKET